MPRAELVEQLRGGLIVSCQAPEDSPVHGPRFMAGFARAAEVSGAIGLRVNGAPDVRACRRATALPIIGISKDFSEGWPVYITPSVASAARVVRAGARLVAIDATHRPRRSGLSPGELIRKIQLELGCPVMADVDSLDEGLAAAAAGADIVATTMAGYTEARPTTDGPDLALVRELASRISTPLVCEGRVREPADVAAAFDAGAHAVVVGTAITNPVVLTRWFVAATPRAKR